MQTLFLLDTGASRTFVKQSWLDRVVGPAALDISPVSTEQILAFHGELVDCLIYELAVTLPMTEEDGSEVHQMVFPAEIAGFPAHNEGRLHVHGLLGRDFLACMNLVYDGPSETFRMADSRHVAKFAK